MSIDDRLEKLAERHATLMRSKALTHRDLQDLLARAQPARQLRQDGERIQSLVRVSEAREHRLSGLEGV